MKKEMAARSKTRNEVERSFPEMRRLQEMENARAFAQLSNMTSSFYGGVDPRLRQEVADSAMVTEDHNAMANLSTRAIHSEVLPLRFRCNPYIDDLVEV